MQRIDLNSDIGESFGPWELGDDEALLRVITSANIACGMHAGDPGVMRRTVDAALAHGVAIGAHPGLPDLVGFGRRRMSITPQEAYDLVLYQVGALSAFLRTAGGQMQHVKPHGAFYNMAAKDAELADAIARAVCDISPELILFGLSGSELIAAGERAGLRTASEVFADRRYQPDGALAPRADGAGVIHEAEEVAQQVLRMMRDGKVAAGDSTVEVKAETVCIHGDTPDAGELARGLRERLEQEGVRVCALWTE